MDLKSKKKKKTSLASAFSRSYFVIRVIYGIVARFSTSAGSLHTSVYIRECCRCNGYAVILSFKSVHVLQCIK